MAIQDNIIQYYMMDESAGATRIDSVNAYNLADNNTVGSGTGIINGSATFNGVNKFLTVATNSTMQLSGSKSFSCWVKLASKAADGTVLGKWLVGNYEYIIQYTKASDRFWLAASQSGTTKLATANNFGPPTIGVWYHITAGYDATNNQIWISVNAGTRDITAYVLGTGGHGANFTIGKNDDGNQQYWNGEIDEVGVWNRFLTTAESTALYNSGAGFAFPFGVTPTARLSQLGVLVVDTSTSVPARLSQLGVLVVDTSTTVPARLSQLGVLVVYPTYASAYVSQVGLFTVQTASPNAQVSQVGLFTVQTASPKAQVSQVGLFVVWAKLGMIVSQEGLLVVNVGTPRILVSQEGSLVVNVGTPQIRVSQAGMLVITANTPTAISSIMIATM